MPKRVLPLTPLQVERAKPSEETAYLFDGGGLYLQIEAQKYDAAGKKLPATKSWKLKYRFGGKSASSVKMAIKRIKDERDGKGKGEGEGEGKGKSEGKSEGEGGERAPQHNRTLKAQAEQILNNPDLLAEMLKLIIKDDAYADAFNEASLPLGVKLVAVKSS